MESIIKLLKEERVCKIELTDDNKLLLIDKDCNNYYDIRLTKSQVIQLILELKQLIDKMES